MEPQPIISISIPETREVLNPTRHTIYKISIRGPVRSWSVNRRYSDFDALHSKLCEIKIPEVALPPKTLFKFKDDIINERRAGLERYLQSILNSKDSIWRQSRAWHRFLDLPEVKTASTQFNITTTPIIDQSKWILEYETLLGFFSEIKVFLHENDNFTKRGNISGAQGSKFQARKGLKVAKEKFDLLEASLKDRSYVIALSGAELTRRTDLLTNMKLELNRLNQIANSTSYTDANRTKTESSARRELFADSSSKPKSFRNFGITPVETEQTKSLDDQGLLQLQNKQLLQQDKSIDVLAKIVKRQKEIGMAISNELDVQNAMLDSLSDAVDKVDGGLKTADKKMKRILDG